MSPLITSNIFLYLSILVVPGLVAGIVGHLKQSGNNSRIIELVVKTNLSVLVTLAIYETIAFTTGTRKPVANEANFTGLIADVSILFEFIILSSFLVYNLILNLIKNSKFAAKAALALTVISLILLVSECSYLKNLNQPKVTVSKKQVLAYFSTPRLRVDSLEILNYLKAYPDDPEVLLQRAKSQKDKNPKQAIKSTRHLLELEKNNFTAMEILGDCLYAVGEFEESLKQFEKIKKQNPKNSGMVRKIADVLLAKGDYRKAIEKYNLALEKDKDQSEILNQRALCYLGLEDYEKAISDSNKVIQKAKAYLKENPELQKTRQSGKLPSREWIKNAALFSRANKTRGLAHKNLGKTKLAIADFRNILLFDSKPDTFLNLAECCLLEGKEDEARKVLRYGLRENPRNDKMLEELKKLLLKENERRRSLNNN